MTKNFKVGDRVSIRIPGNWERCGTITETDLHPLGTDNAVRIQFYDGLVDSQGSDWWDARYVFPIAKEQSP